MTGMWPIAPLLVGLCWVGFAHAVSAGAGSGWRRPTAVELKESWRQRNPTRFAVARGDFDGDGKADEARLMLSKDGKRLALVVTLSGSGERGVFYMPERSGDFVHIRLSD